MSNFDRNTYAYGSGVAQAGAAAGIDQGLRSFMLGVYNNMILGLAISGLVALGTNMLAVTNNAAGAVARVGTDLYLTQVGYALYATPLKWLVILAPLAFIFFFSFRIEKMSAGAARSTFLLFSAVMGLSLSSLFVVFKLGSIVQVFFITATAFAALSLVGYTTKKSLSAMGSFLIMGVFGLILASLVNIFLQSSGLQFAISALGVLIFAGLTAYDTQKLKEMYIYGGMSAEGVAKASIMGALTLYLDFINMFQFLLSLMGNRNN